MFPNTNDLASQAKFDNIIDDNITLVIAWISPIFRNLPQTKFRSLNKAMQNHGQLFSL